MSKLQALIERVGELKDRVASAKRAYEAARSELEPLLGTAGVGNWVEATSYRAGIIEQEKKIIDPLALLRVVRDKKILAKLLTVRVTEAEKILPGDVVEKITQVEKVPTLFVRDLKRS